MHYSDLVSQIKAKQSFLCVGLDIDEQKLPHHLKGTPNGVVDFAKAIIEATEPYAVSYKVNTAFFEARGVKGWEQLAEIIGLLNNHSGAPTFNIADAKRGDIGNTSNEYAKAFFEALPFDAITVAPYMGSDSISPFLKYPGKWAISLALTSNQGALDFQMQQLANGKYLFEEVLATTATWGTTENLMFVAGATRAEHIAKVRAAVPHHFLLVPGVGAQGGSLADVWNYGANENVGLLVNASRSILYASSGTDFAEAASIEAQLLQQEMAGYLAQMG
ncbi:MAG: orotidine-5'-phosphate decarboxylase [Flexibacteraceae bacterium]